VIKKGENIVGNRTKVKIVKNKVAAPFRTAEFDIFYNEGISFEGDILNLGSEKGIIKKAGASYSYGTQRLGVGFEAAKLKLRETPELCAEVIQKIREEYKKEHEG